VITLLQWIRGDSTPGLCRIRLETFMVAVEERLV
jgi:hypothetical protein